MPEYRAALSGQSLNLEEVGHGPDYRQPPLDPRRHHPHRDGRRVVLHGNALMALLNAAFHGSGTVEILGGDLDRHRMEVIGIEMQGRETRVTLAAMDARQRLT